jgi:uncharacterized protein YdeI (YjbR/CyaY-like superfamily)
MSELPELLVPDAAAWRAWLAEHHSGSRGVWLVLHKKGGDVTTLTYAQALDEALCFGWIDGQGRRRDAAASLQRMTPRTSRSPWSARNVGYVERLEREGRMQSAGRAAVEAAKGRTGPRRRRPTAGSTDSPRRPRPCRRTRRRCAPRARAAGSASRSSGRRRRTR